MIALSVLLPAPVSRWLSVAFGALYIVIEVLTLSGDALFYRIVVVLEIALTLTIVWLALRWPKTADHTSPP
jgi:hypothetical protein